MNLLHYIRNLMSVYDYFVIIIIANLLHTNCFLQQDCNICLLRHKLEMHSSTLVLLTFKTIKKLVIKVLNFVICHLCWTKKSIRYIRTFVISKFVITVNFCKELLTTLMWTLENFAISKISLYPCCTTCVYIKMSFTKKNFTSNSGF